MPAVNPANARLDPLDFPRMKQIDINAKAAILANKLAETMKWEDRHLGYKEWSDLVDALNAPD